MQELWLNQFDPVVPHPKYYPVLPVLTLSTHNGGRIQSLTKLPFSLWLPTVASSVPNAEAVRDNMAAD